MRITSMLYRAARISNNLSALSRPARIPRRAKNIVIGKTLAKTGFWKGLWK